MAETRTTSASGGQKGVKVERHDLIPVGPLRELAVHFGRGARKYDDHQWRKGYEWSKSIGALERHLKLFELGLDYDVCSNEPDNCALKISSGEVITYNFLDATTEVTPDEKFVVSVRIGDKVFEPFDNTFEPNTCYNHTGSHHMVAVMWHSAVLLEFKDHFPEYDDRFRYPPKEV